MNILVEKLPEYVKIDGTEVKINADFRFSIHFEQLINDNALKDEEIFKRALKIYYPKIPNNIKEAIERMLWFYRGGKEIIRKKKSTVLSREEIYSFEYDADKIYSAFLDQYGVDLQEVNMHWWKFRAMFNGLKDDNEISKIMSVRAMDINKIKDKTMKEHYAKLKKLYVIPRSEKEVKYNKKLATILKSGGDLSKLQE